MGTQTHTTRLREWRLAHDYSENELADLTGLTQAYISRLERGVRGASHATKVRIARALGVPVRDLFDPNGQSA